MEEQENALANRVRIGLSAIPEVTLYQSLKNTSKTPTIAFRVEGISPAEFCLKLAEEHAIFVADGDFYASTLAEKLKINDKGGWIRAGLAPYNSEVEIEKFVEAVKQVAKQAVKIK